MTAWQTTYNISEPSFLSTYETFVTELRVFYPTQPFFIFTPWGWPAADGTVSYYYTSPSPYAQLVQNRNDMGDYNIFLVNTTGWVSWADVFPTNQHPTEEGHVKVAAQFTTWLTEWGLSPLSSGIVDLHLLIVMFVTVIAASIALTFTRMVLAQAGVSCITYGATSCPYAGATTTDLLNLISEFCGDNGGWPYYQYTGELDISFPYQGYYSVTSNGPGYFDQDTCNTALNHIVTECDSPGTFWVQGEYQDPATGIWFSVIPCQLA
ncbi:hypothetical protein DACRYDRAFT_116218 [Dacryopinax primogenitus]|uniref:Uncharacterized protein n=1 Tax=Dacryopinax primogenitus (strain DJM 731) TaxID=1858805 RepID=M5FZ26_DACPD|nr:uncharacterized protein DACRYDRAFT_116218 [Dacryopinax primogenitus]EJU01759.1 hypothetical protein DACRYDRAFT_116218 [Dacryopinax primogenitus]